MASIEFDAPSGFYRIVFRYGRQRFKRSLKVKDADLAESLCGRVEETLSDLRRGRLIMPANADPGTFILSDGKIEQKPVAAHAEPITRTTIEELVEVYKSELPEGAKEENSLRTERIHVAHVKRILGAKTPLETIDLAEARRYAKLRLKEKHGKNVRRPIRPYTVRKELKSFRRVWAWCYAGGHVAVEPCWKLSDITLPRDQEPEPFRTMAEIQQRIDRGGLTAGQEKALWSCLFLTGPELVELLDHVKGVPLEPFVFPMFALAVYTGARRSELLRSQIHDFDFEHDRVQIREKKRVRGASSVRWVDIHPKLLAIMKNWFKRHPCGQFTLAQPDGRPLNVHLMDHRFEAAVRGSKFETMRGFHVVRHSFCSVLASKGVDQRIINSFVGHQDERTAARYRHLIPATLKSAILALTD